MDKNKQIRSLVNKIVKEEITNFLPSQHHDHEAKMSKGEIRSMIKNGVELYNMIQEGENLPGWVSAYITLSADYIHSVHQYMTENKNNY
jgi:hypothetical protein